MTSDNSIWNSMGDALTVDNTGSYWNIAGPGTIDIGQLTVGGSGVSDINIGPVSFPIISKDDAEIIVLKTFFGEHVHALMMLQDHNTRIIPFIDKLNIIWLQRALDSWQPFDRSKFYDFVDNPDNKVFVEDQLNKAEVLSRLSNPNESGSC